MLKTLTVTQIRLAFECPRLFYLGERFQTQTLFLPKGATPGLGKAFHDLSAAFVPLMQQDGDLRRLLTAETDSLEQAAIAQAMQHLFYEQVFYPYLQRAIAQNPAIAPALLHLWQGLCNLIQRWAQLLLANRRYCPANELIQKTFLAQEMVVEHCFTLADGAQQLVKGRFDSLVYDFEQHRLCVVEYKTYQMQDAAAQVAQVALYGYLLHQRVGVPIDSVVYSVLPDWKEQTFTWQQLTDAIHHLIPIWLERMQQWLTWQPFHPDPPPATTQPELLCPMCPQYERCQSFFQAAPPPPLRMDEQTPARLPRPTPPPAPPPKATITAATNADQMGANLVQILQSFGVEVSYIGAAVGPAFVRVRLKPQPGVKVSSILRLTDDLRVQLGLPGPPLIAPQAGHVSVDLPRAQRQTARFEQYIQTATTAATDPVQIAIGVDLEGKLVEADLSDPNTCHFLIGGTTGSGKSEFLRSLLLSLIVRHSPDHLRIALVDPKRVTFPEFEQMPWLLAPVAKESDRAIQLMESLVQLMESRYQTFERVGCNNLRGYNQRQPDAAMYRLVCIFDEYADFMAEKETRNALETSIKRLGAMARAAGIHLIIATQRPEARVITPLIRSNLPGRIALKTASAADSMIILGGRETAAVALLGKGDLLYQRGADLLRLQSLFAGKVQPPWQRK